jgi:hypothetical protein
MLGLVAEARDGVVVFGSQPVIVPPHALVVVHRYLIVVFF